MKMALEDITPEEFAFKRLSHNSSDEYFDCIGADRDRYKPAHLSITLIEPPNKDFSYHAELLLAKRAIEKRCEYVTNLDYCQADYDKGRLILAGTGWMRKDGCSMLGCENHTLDIDD